MKKDKAMKEITAEQLIDIIGIDRIIIEEEPSFVDENSRHFVKDDKDEIVYNYDSYVLRAKERIKEMELDNHIIIELNKGAREYGEMDHLRIELINLRIKFNSYETLYLDRLRASDGAVQIYFYLGNNEFISMREGASFYFSLNCRDPSPNLHTMFVGNKFLNIDLHINGGSSDRVEFNFNNNELKRFIINSIADINLNGGNVIEYLKISDMRYIYFSPYQEVDKSGEYANTQRKDFLTLLEAAFKRNDFPQAKILQIEIIKCDHHILKHENRLKGTRQDRIIMLWSYHVSRYGTVWLRPSIWLLSINLFLLSLIYLLYEDVFDWTYWWIMFFRPDFWEMLFLEDFWMMFFKFLNPLAKPNEVLGENITPLSLGIYTFQKVLFVALVYEIVKAFRRFAIK